VGPLAVGVVTGHVRAWMLTARAGCALALTLGYLGWSRLCPPARLPARSKTAPAMENAPNTPGIC
jgi:hypothetical protein